MTRDGKRISFHRNRNIRTSKARDEETINAFPDPGSQKGSGRREVEKLLQQNKLLFFHKKIDLVGRAFYSKGIHFIGKERVVVDQAQPTRKRGSPKQGPFLRPSRSPCVLPLTFKIATNKTEACRRYRK